MDVLVLQLGFGSVLEFGCYSICKYEVTFVSSCCWGSWLGLRITFSAVVSGFRPIKPESMVRMFSPSGEACNRGQAENKAYTTALATSTVVLLQENVGTRHLTDST